MKKRLKTHEKTPKNAQLHHGVVAGGGRRGKDQLSAAGKQERAVAGCWRHFWSVETVQGLGPLPGLPWRPVGSKHETVRLLNALSSLTGLRAAKVSTRERGSIKRGMCLQVVSVVGLQVLSGRLR